MYYKRILREISKVHTPDQVNSQVQKKNKDILSVVFILSFIAISFVASLLNFSVYVFNVNCVR